MMGSDHTALVEKNCLHSSLVALARADIAADYLCIRAKNQHGLTNVKVNQLQMGIILYGQKQLNIPTKQLNLGAGDIVIMKPDTIIDAVNIPDQETGEYLTILVPICEEVIKAAQMIWAKPITDKTAEVLKFSIHDFSTQLTEWQTALFCNDWVKARLCITAILIQLCQKNYADVLIVPPPKLSKTIHEWVSEEPQRNWQSRDIEMRLGMSGATLRRKLSHENTSLRETIAHARLAYAIGLLYSSKLPMKTVAAKSGYQSVATFRERFLQRYGIDPSVLSVE